MGLKELLHRRMYREQQVCFLHISLLHNLMSCHELQCLRFAYMSANLVQVLLACRYVSNVIVYLGACEEREEGELVGTQAVLSAVLRAQKVGITRL